MSNDIDPCLHKFHSTGPEGECKYCGELRDPTYRTPMQKLEAQLAEAQARITKLREALEKINNEQVNPYIVARHALISDSAPEVSTCPNCGDPVYSNEKHECVCDGASNGR